jgi:hypothetical protein
MRRIWIKTSMDTVNACTDIKIAFPATACSSPCKFVQPCCPQPPALKTVFTRSLHRFQKLRLLISLQVTGWSRLVKDTHSSITKLEYALKLELDYSCLGLFNNAVSTENITSSWMRFRIGKCKCDLCLGQFETRKIIFGISEIRTKHFPNAPQVAYSVTTLWLHLQF